MHAHSIAGFLSAWLVAYVTITAFCLSSRRGKKRETELLLFGIFCITLTVHTGGAIAIRLTEGTNGVRVALALFDAGRAIAAACLVHVVAQLSQMRLPRQTLVLIYGVAFVMGTASAIDLGLHGGSVEDVSADVLGVRLLEVASPARALGTAVSIGALAAASFSSAVLVRSVSRGRRDLWPSTLGIVVFLASALHDAAHGIAGHEKPMAIPYGFAAFVMGVLMSLVSRYVALRNRLEERASELKQRSTELKKSYEELRAAQAEIVRKEQLAAVGELSAVVAHEVRNPLAIITTAVATLRREGLVEDDRQTLLGILDEEASRLNRLVGDLLVYTRPVRCNRQLISARDIVERALALASDNPNVVINLHETEGLERIHGDPMLLRQVFENIVNNAVQAMPEGGSLTISIEPQVEAGESGVEVRFVDTGEGMDTAVRDRALDPFFTTRATGTGLGLAIVARIINAHGGKLRITSDEGTGTEVKVFLPRHGEASPTRISVPPESIRSSSLPPMPKELQHALMNKRT